MTIDALSSSPSTAAGVIVIAVYWLEGNLLPIEIRKFWKLATWPVRLSE
jgi:hypothetical protein